MKKYFSIFSAVLLLMTVSAFAQETSVSGVKVSKTATYENGVGEITLEAFATGQTVKTITESHVPTDIVLVLDVSGSMDDNITYNTKTEVTSGELAVGQSYKVVIDGKEYFLKGFKEETKDGYRYEALSGNKWSYDTVNGKEYYVEDDGKYYLVHADSESGKSFGKKYTNYYLYYEKTITSFMGKQTYKMYLKDNGSEIYKQTVDSPSKVIYTGTLYKKVATGASTTYYYRYGTSEPSSKTSGNEFYTGNSIFTVGSTAQVSNYKIYKAGSSTTISKIAALRNAATDFINQIAADASQYNVDHRISIVKFASDNTSEIGNGKTKSGYNYSQVINDFQSAKTKKTDLTNTIGKLTAGGGTRASDGMAHAKNVILGSSKFTGSAAYYKSKNITEYGRVVVMFTDGEPGDYGFTGRGSTTSGTGYDNGYYVANQAVARSKEMKDAGVTVYTIGVFSNPSDNAKHYLDVMSSNYSKADKAFNGTTRATFTKDDDGFYQMSNGADLSDIFQTIANETSSGGATKQELDATTILRDIINADFNLPAGATAQDIKIYVSQCTGCTPDPANPKDADKATYTFSSQLNQVFGKGTGTIITPNPSTPGFKNIVATVENKNGHDVVDVKGFSYKDYWCGNDNNNGTTTLHAGYKIVVKVPFVCTTFHDDYSTYETNAPESGLYSDNGKKLVIPFPIPELYSIIIEKDGLEAGETAIFNVFKKDASGNYGTTPAYTTMIVGGENIAATGKDVQIIGVMNDGTYKVVEDTGWSWTYTADKQSVEHTLSEAQLVKFSFMNTKKPYTGDDPLPMNAEATVTNNMNENAENSANSN